MRLGIIPVLREHPMVLLLAVSTTLLTTGQGMVAPILPLYADSLGVSLATVGLVISVFGLARFLTNMPTAVLSERFGRRSVLVGGPLIAAAGNALAGTADTLAPLMVYRFIAGVGSAAFITGAVIFIGDISTPANRGRLMSIYQGSFALGITLGPSMGGLIAEIFGLRGPFFAVGAVSLVSGIWAFFRVPETRPSSDDADGRPQAGRQDGPVTQEGRWSRYSFLKSRDFILVGLVLAVIFFTRGGAQFTLLPLKGSDELGLSPGQIGAIFTIPPVLAFLLLPFSGSVSDRFGRKKTIVPGLLIVSIAMMVLGASPTLMLYAVGMTLFGLGNGIQGPTPVAYVADISPRSRQSIAQGAARSFGDLALLIAPPLMGLAADAFGATTALVGNGAIVGVVGLAFLLFARESVTRQPGAREERTGGHRV